MLLGRNPSRYCKECHCYTYYQHKLCGTDWCKHWWGRNDAKEVAACRAYIREANRQQGRQKALERMKKARQAPKTNTTPPWRKPKSFPAEGYTVQYVWTHLPENQIQVQAASWPSTINLTAPGVHVPEPLPAVEPEPASDQQVQDVWQESDAEPPTMQGKKGGVGAHSAVGSGAGGGQSGAGGGQSGGGAGAGGASGGGQSSAGGEGQGGSGGEGGCGGGG